MVHFRGKAIISRGVWFLTLSQLPRLVTGVLASPGPESEVWGNQKVIHRRGLGRCRAQVCWRRRTWTTQCDCWGDVFTSDQSTELVHAQHTHRRTHDSCFRAMWLTPPGYYSFHVSLKEVCQWQRETTKPVSSLKTIMWILCFVCCLFVVMYFPP